MDVLVYSEIGQRAEGQVTIFTFERTFFRMDSLVNLKARHFGEHLRNYCMSLS